MPKVLVKEDLPQFLKELEAYHPQTLAVYQLAKNIVDDSQFAWPGIQFVVDQFPDHTACLVKPVPNDPNYVPRHTTKTHSPCAKNVKALRQLITTPGVIDWSKPVFFGPVWLPFAEAVVEICRENGTCIGPQEREDFTAFAVWFPEDKLTPGPMQPEGFTIRPLTREEAKTVNAIWRFGGTPATEKFILYLYDHGFPTMGIFDPENQMAGYELCNSEMILTAAYVAPEYRNRKFFQMISYAWCQKMFELGVKRPVAFSAEQNISSHSAMFRLGAERANWELAWVMYIPKNYDDPNDDFLHWKAQLGDVIWKQK